MGGGEGKFGQKRGKFTTITIGRFSRRSENIQTKRSGVSSLKTKSKWGEGKAKSGRVCNEQSRPSQEGFKPPSEKRGWGGGKREKKKTVDRRQKMPRWKGGGESVARGGESQKKKKKTVKKGKNRGGLHKRAPTEKPQTTDNPAQQTINKTCRGGFALEKGRGRKWSDRSRNLLCQPRTGGEGGHKIKKKKREKEK